MNNPLSMKSWSSYVAGAGIGLLSWFASNMFDSPSDLVLGLLTGIVFGILLQKGRVSKFEVIVGQFLVWPFLVTVPVQVSPVVARVGAMQCQAS